MLTFLDPPRPDTKQTIEDANKYGVAVKMITGEISKKCNTHGHTRCYTYRHCHTHKYKLSDSATHSDTQAIICSLQRRRPKFSRSARTLSRPKVFPCLTQSPNSNRITYLVTTVICVLRLTALPRYTAFQLIILSHRFIFLLIYLTNINVI